MSDRSDRKWFRKSDGQTDWRDGVQIGSSRCVISCREFKCLGEKKQIRDRAVILAKFWKRITSFARRGDGLQRERDRQTGKQTETDGDRDIHPSITHNRYR